LLLAALAAAPAYSHELILKPADFEAAPGSELALELQSTHVFIVREEVEDITKIEAGAVSGGALVKSELVPNEPELRIDLSVKIPQGNGSTAVIANKTGDIWSVTPEGWKPGTRKSLEDQGIKVVRASMTDKFAKVFINASADDENFAVPAGQELEIVPVTNPADARVGEYFKVRVVYKGENASAPVLATYDGFVTEYENTYAYYTESGSDGTAAIKITSPGLWIIRASITGEPGVPGEYDSRNVNSILTILVK
jgi:uncharacterized GH25 family protein